MGVMRTNRLFLRVLITNRSIIVVNNLARTDMAQLLDGSC